LLCLVQWQGLVNKAKDMLVDLGRQSLLERSREARRLLPPLCLLWPDVGGAWYGPEGVNEEEAEDLAMAWLGWIDELKGRYAVLEDL